MTELAIFMAGIAVTVLFWVFIRVGEAVEREHIRQIGEERVRRLFR